MKAEERKRRAKLRRQAKARRARKLFREFVANKRPQWDAEVAAARMTAEHARAEMRRVQAMFDALTEIVLAVNPDFPVPGREPRPAPRYVVQSGFRDVPKPRKWGALLDASNTDWHTISEHHLREWFSFIRYDLDNDRMRRSSVFTVTVTNREIGESAGIQYAISNELLCSAVPLNMLLIDSARQASRGIIEHMRKS
jgi:hypothetical protein